MDFPEVSRMAGAVSDVAGRLEGIAAGIRTWEYACQDAVDGASMCYSSTSLVAGQWVFTLGRLADEVRGLGDDLRRAATDYRDADAAAAAGF
jgi:uncharacterized protein YukE